MTLRDLARSRRGWLVAAVVLVALAAAGDQCEHDHCPGLRPHRGEATAAGQVGELVVLAQP